MIQCAFVVHCVSGVRQDAMPHSSTSAVFTQLAAYLHNLHDAIKGEQHHDLKVFNHVSCKLYL